MIDLKDTLGPILATVVAVKSWMVMGLCPELLFPISFPDSFLCKTELEGIRSYESEFAGAASRMMGRVAGPCPLLVGTQAVNSKKAECWLFLVKA
jgi:hypothetical protein